MDSAVIGAIGAVVSAIAGLLAAFYQQRAARNEIRRARTRLDAVEGQWLDLDTDAVHPVGKTDDGEPSRQETEIQVTRRSATGRQIDQRVLRLSTIDRDEIGEIVRDELDKDREVRRKEERKAERRTFLLNFVQSAFFFALGVGVTLLVS